VTTIIELKHLGLRRIDELRQKGPGKQQRLGIADADQEAGAEQRQGDGT
jgi:hypothetical protein